jgi:hypothetical protein
MPFSRELLRSINRIPVPFKVAYSEFTQEYNLNPNWTAKDLLNQVGALV